MNRLLLFLFFVVQAMFGEVSNAQTGPTSPPIFNVVPANPTVLDQITLTRVPNTTLQGCIDASYIRVALSLVNSNIDITYIDSVESCIDFATRPVLCIDCNWVYRIGPLPAGAYTLRILNSKGILLGSQALTVAPVESLTDAVYPRFNYADTYYSPTESGWGLHLVQTQSRQLVGALYVYDQAGRPTWYLIRPGTWVTPTRYETKAFKTTGTFFGGSSFQAGPQQEVGTVTLEFLHWVNNGFLQVRLSYVIEGVSKTIYLMRQRL